MENPKEDKEDREDSNVENESLSSSSDEAEEQDSDSGINKFSECFEQTMHIFDPNTSENKFNILSELSLDGIVDYIKDNKVTKIITMAGAGISTSAGIPDFRSPTTGLYDHLEKYNLPYPQAIFEIEFFKSNPKPFFVLTKELLPEGYKPTKSHYFIRLLHEKGLLLRHYTQNVDDLERMAGLPEEKLVEAHGTFHTGHCLDCKTMFNLDWMKSKIKEDIIPICENCNKGVIKPDIVFFGEKLSERFHTLLSEDFVLAELLIIMGSSLIVQPFASLIDNVLTDCPRLLINKEKVGVESDLLKCYGISRGMNFESGRDVAWLGECDEGCQLLADKLEWGEELKTLMLEEHRRLDSDAIIRKEKADVNSDKATKT